MDTAKFIPADPFSLTLFITFSLIMFSGFLSLIRRTSESKKWTVLFVTLVTVFSWASYSGMVRQQFIPIGPLLFFLVLVFALNFSFSKAGKQFALALPLAWLIGFQGFRVPLELLLHHWAELSTVPPTMTWTGQNWDIAAGAVALLAIPFVNRNRKLALVVNVFCFALLLNVGRVVVMSSPLPFAWPLENPLMLLGYFPYALIGPLFVMPALIGHILVFRKLAQEKVLSPV